MSVYYTKTTKTKTDVDVLDDKTVVMTDWLPVRGGEKRGEKWSQNDLAYTKGQSSLNLT